MEIRGKQIRESSHSQTQENSGKKSKNEMEQKKVGSVRVKLPALSVRQGFLRLFSLDLPLDCTVAEKLLLHERVVLAACQR